MTLDKNRKFYITGSEANAIVNIDKWKKPEEVLFNKLFGYSDPPNENTTHGHKYEPVALKKFESVYGIPVRRISDTNFIQHSTYPWLGGSVDGIATLTTGENVVLEVKCPRLRPIIVGRFPDYYYIQCQIYMELTGYEKCLFIQYKPEYLTPVRHYHHPEQFEVLTIPRHKNYMLSKLPALKAFWDKLWLFRQTTLKYMIGKSWQDVSLSESYIPGISWRILKEILRYKSHTTLTNSHFRNTITFLAKLHWICRFKAATVRHYVQNTIPYQTPMELMSLVPCLIKNDSTFTTQSPYSLSHQPQSMFSPSVDDPMGGSAQSSVAITEMIQVVKIESSEPKQNHEEEEKVCGETVNHSVQCVKSNKEIEINNNKTKRYMPPNMLFIKRM